jgi:hypothetical protein
VREEHVDKKHNSHNNLR